MGRTNYNPKEQRRFWIGTVWVGHCIEGGLPADAEHDEIMRELRQWWARASEHPSVSWMEGQIEVSSTGNLHIQVACKTNDSKRWGWMAKHLPASWQPAENWPAVLNYCKKTDSRIEYLGGVGTKPKSKMTKGAGSAKLRAINYIKDGKSPEWIAINDMDAYFTHHRAIKALWEATRFGMKMGIEEEEE